MTFDMSAAWRDATTMIGRNREVLSIIAGIFFFLPNVASGFIVPAMPEALMSDPERMQAEILAFYANYGWVTLLVLVLQMLGTLALLSLLRDKRGPTVGEAIRAGLAGLLPAIGTFLLLGVALGAAVMIVALIIGLLAAIGSAGGLLGVLLLSGLMVGMAIVWVRVSLVSPVIAIDKVRNPALVLRRSWRLTRGHTFRLLLFYLLLAIVYMVVAIVAGMIVGALLFVLGDLVSVIVGSLVSGLIAAVAAVIYVGVLAAVHRQLAGPWSAAMAEGRE